MTLRQTNGRSWSTWKRSTHISIISICRPSFRENLMLISNVADVWLCGRGAGGSASPLWHWVGRLNCLETPTNALLPPTVCSSHIRLQTVSNFWIAIKHGSGRQLLCNVLISKNLYSSWQQWPRHADVVFCHVTIINTGTMSSFIFWRMLDAIKKEKRFINPNLHWASGFNG